jgi:hypothetical protein
MVSNRRAGLQRSKDKRSTMRSSVFPDLDEARIWDVKNKTRTKGYTSLPRTMPLIGAMMDMLSGKGKPLATTYLELWCRSDEQGFVILNKQIETAFASGFSGERGVSTWRERIRRLETLEFISTKSGTSGDLHYVQIWNPYLVIKKHYDAKTHGFSEKHYHVFLERYLDIGAVDLESPPQQEPALSGFLAALKSKVSTEVKDEPNG